MINLALNFNFILHIFVHIYVFVNNGYPYGNDLEQRPPPPI